MLKTINIAKRMTVFLACLLALVCLFTACNVPGNDPGENTLPATNTPAPGGFSPVEADGVATVSLAGGVNYSATGYEAITSDGFSFEDSILLKFEGIGKKSFNRFTLSYSSSGPVEIVVVYREGESADADNYYLEKGSAKEFSGLVSGSIDGEKRSGISEIRVKALNGKTKFAATGISTETVEFPKTDSDGNIFIENSRYRLGVRLAWGGGISYILDKNANIPGLTNLINQHDTGRLVQQSYYGTGPIEGVYDPGSFLGNVWVYNPVQGGDRYMTKSRLVDVRIEENAVYVKTQPKDWGNNDLLLPCYMENTYWLYEDRIQVDNRFVDYSGFVHPYGLQELPAFYTVSYLDTLVYYNGREPWTDGELTVRSDVTDWTLPENAGQNRFDIIRGNTEVWAAFVNLEDDFGIGVYTPNYELLNAGRYCYDGSKDSKADSTNYIAPRSELQIVKYQPLEYSYLIASGSVSEMREVFKANKNFTYNVSLTLMARPDTGTDELYDFTNIDFTKEGTEKLFYNIHNTEITYDEEVGCVKFLVTEGFDVYCGLNLDNNGEEPLEAEDYQLVEIEYMIPKTNSSLTTMMELFLGAGDFTSAAPENSVYLSYIPDGKFHKVRVNLTAKEVWEGTIHMFRLDYFTDCVTGDAFYIKSFGLKKAEGAVSYENIDFTERSGIFAVANTIRTSVSYDETEKAARFDVIDGNDVNVSINYAVAVPALNAANYDCFEIEYMIPKSNKLPSYRYEMYFCVGNVADPTEDNVARGRLKKDGQYHTLQVPMSDFATASGKMIMLRFDYFAECATGDVIYVKNIRLVEKQG